MVFRIPRWQERSAIVDAMGVPVRAFTRYLDELVLSKIENVIRDIQETNERQDETDERILRILAGEENFTAILVENQQVQDFLSKTDGSALVVASGLGTEVVETTAVKQNDITDSVDAFNPSGVILNGTTTVELISGSITGTGKTIDLEFSGYATIRAPLADPFHITVRLLRNGVTVVPVNFVGAYSFERAGEQFFAGEIPRITISDAFVGVANYTVEAELDIATATTQETFALSFKAREHRTEG